MNSSSLNFPSARHGTPSFLLYCFLSLCLISLALGAPLDSNCVVSILNRSSQVRPDGTWRVDNVPANFGLVRVRATCTKDGVTRSGQSDFIVVEPNVENPFSPFELGNEQPVPQSLTLTTPASTLNSLAATAQLTVIATYPDGTTKNVTTMTNGTSYTVSSPATASISPDGLVTARASGTVVISVINDGAVGLIQLHVVLSGDSDGDGIPDDLEMANGLNPNNPVDAEEDPDGDGLTNLQELMVYGTNPRLADTDGDGISDADEVRGRLGFVTSPVLADTDGDGVRDLLEIQTGTDPTDRNSVNYAAALQSLEVNPSSFVLTVNTIIGEASRQLMVIGHFKDGTTIDLTSTARGTVYSSSDLNIANFGSPDGRVFAGTNGTATITVSNSTFTATATVTVRSSSPQTLGFVDIPGGANNVDVGGNYAYVAAGGAGLHVVDVSDRRSPRIVATFDTPGNANDVKVAGNFVFIADGASGLQIVNVANPLAPAPVASLDTPGDAQDVTVVGGRAYIADGPSGLQIADISTPSSPRILGSVDTPGACLGVDVSGNIAVVADGTSGIQVVDVSDPTHPSIIGSRSYGGDAHDVAVQGNYAFVADVSASFTSIDITDPRNPVVRASTPRATGGLLEDVVVAGRFAFGADIFFFNGIPIIDVGQPASPTPRAILDFRAFGDENGTGIAVDSSYVYLTAGSRLYIGQYLEVQDTLGVSPTLTITRVTPPSIAFERETISVSVDASDDVGVAQVNVLLNGVPFGSATVPPYEFRLSAPVGVSLAIIEVQALDFAANAATQQVVLSVIPDPGTTVIGRVVDASSNGVAGVVVSTLENRSAVTAADGSFRILNVPTIIGNIRVTARTSVSNLVLFGSSLSFPPARGGETDVGTILLQQQHGLEMRMYDTPDPVGAVANGFVGLTPGEFTVTTANDSFMASSYVVPVVNFPDTDFDISAFYNVGPNGIIDPNGDDISIQPPGGNDGFGAQFRGYLFLPTGGDVTFNVGVDDAFDLTVNRQSVVRFLGGTDFAVFSGTATGLPAGLVPIVLNYGDIGGEANIVLSASGGGLPGGVIPAEFLSPDPGTSVVGAVVDTNGNPVAGASVMVSTNFASVTGADGRFAIVGVPTIQADISATATASVDNLLQTGVSGSIRGVPGGITDLGNIVIRPQPVWHEVIIPNLPANASLGAVWARARDEVYVWAGRTIPGTADVPECFLYRWDGSNWTQVLHLPNHYGSRVFGTGPAEVFASAVTCTNGFAARCVQNGEVFRSIDRGANWTSLPLPANTVGKGLGDMSGTPGNIHVILPGTGILRFDNTNWTTFIPHPTEYPFVLTVLDDDEGYYITCFGWGRWNGTNWIFNGIQFDFCDIYAVWAIRDIGGNLVMYAVGNNNFSNGIRVWRFNPLTGSFGSKSGYVFSDGNGFNVGTAHGIWGSSADDVYVIGQLATASGGPRSGRIYHYDGSNWAPVTVIGGIPVPGGVHGAARDDVWVTTGDRILRFGVPTSVPGGGGIAALMLGNGEQPSTSSPPEISFQLSGAGEMELRVSGQQGRMCVIEVSNDLVHWTNLTATVATGTPQTFIDINAQSYSCRFYRARMIK